MSRSHHPHKFGPSAFVPNGQNAKPMEFKLQFASMAGKKRALAAYNEKHGTNETDPAKVDALCAYALPKDLVKVPMLRGFDNGFAGKMRAVVRRDNKRRSESLGEIEQGTEQPVLSDLLPTDEMQKEAAE